MALKTLQILGQILRNFPGALRGDLKHQIARESYSLGLRTLRAIFNLAEEHLDDLRKLFGRVLEEKFEGESKASRDEMVDRWIYFLCLLNAYALIKCISHSVGSEHLEETYREIMADVSSSAIKLVDASIKLDHSRAFPKTDVLRLHFELRRNMFASTVLRWMVRDHFYLFPEKQDLRHSVCKQLSIEVDDPKMLGSAGKRTNV